MSIKKAHRLEEIAQERGVSVGELLPATIEKHGSVLGAAHDLKVAPNTIHNWLANNGLHVETRQVATVVPLNKQTITQKARVPESHPNGT